MSSSPNGNNGGSSGGENTSSPCTCAHLYSSAVLPTAEKGVVKASIVNSMNANILADSLGVSPLYRQQDSARWQSAHHVYQSSRAHSPVRNGGGSTPVQLSTTTAASGSSNIGGSTNECVTPQQLHQTYYEQSSSAVGSPISLEDIAFVNRRRHQEVGDKRVHESKAGALELEAVAAVHELACSVKSIFVSEILPRTADLIFVNIKTHEETGCRDESNRQLNTGRGDRSETFPRQVASVCRIKTAPLCTVVHMSASQRHKATGFALMSEVVPAQRVVYRRAWRQFSCMARFTSRAIPLRARLVHFRNTTDDGQRVAASSEVHRSLAALPNALLPTETMRILHLSNPNKRK